jgi:hypothetical protein
MIQKPCDRGTYDERGEHKKDRWNWLLAGDGSCQTVHRIVSDLFYYESGDELILLGAPAYSESAPVQQCTCGASK